jgi:hypothetical protein
VPWALDEVAGIALLGVVAGTLAALVPALTASRIPTLSALAGRRPERRRRLVSPWVGLVLVVLGLGALSIASGTSDRDAARGAATASVGVLLVMAGAAALSPGVVAGLARLSARRGGTVRLAGRSLARSRARSAAVVSTTAVAVAVPVVLMVWGARIESPPNRPEPGTMPYERIFAAYRTTGAASVDGFEVTPAEIDRTAAEVQRLMGPDAVVGRSVWLRFAGSDVRAVAVDVDALRRVVGEDPVVEALEAGSGVIIEGGRGANGRTGPVREIDPEEMPDVVVRLLEWGDERLVSDEVAAGAPTERQVRIVRPGTLSAAEAESLQSLTEDGAAPPARADLTVEALTASAPSFATGPFVQVIAHSGIVDQPDEEAPIELYAVLGSIVLALAVIGTAGALAAADGRADDRIVAAVGAPPAAVGRRRVVEAVLTAAGATVLGAGLAAVATLVVLHHPFVPEDGFQPGVRVPVLAVGATAVGIVAAVGAATWLAQAAVRLRGRRDLIVVDG